MTPILSIVNVLRNDDYDEFMSYKLNIILEIYDSLFKLIPEKKVELLFVDWGSRKPVLNSLQISKFLSKQISYFHIPPQKAKSINPKESFPVAQAVNFGIRKSRGQYIMITGSDQFLGPQQLSLLLNILDNPEYHFIDPLSLFTMQRKFLNSKWRSWKHSPSQTIEYLNEIDPSLLPCTTGTKNLGSGFGAFLTHRDKIEESLLIDENWNGYGWSDIELFLRSTQNINHINLTKCGIFMYKFPRALGRRKNLADSKTLVKKYHKGYFNLGVPKKSKDWGIDRKYNRIIKEKINIKTRNNSHSIGLQDRDQTYLPACKNSSLLDSILNFICVRFSVNNLFISEYFLRSKKDSLYDFINAFNDFSIFLLRFTHKVGQLDWFSSFNFVAREIERKGFYGKIKQFEINSTTPPSFFSTQTGCIFFPSVILFLTSKKYFLIPQLLLKEKRNFFIFFESKFQLNFKIPKYFFIKKVDDRFSLICHNSNTKIIENCIQYFTTSAE